MKEEQQYLDKTIKTINAEIGENIVEITRQQKQISVSRNELTMNFNDLDDEELSRHKVEIDEADKVVNVLKKNNAKLERQLNKPYFARIDFENQNKKESIYIGLGLVKNQKNILVYDWRAPISSMYYDYDLGQASYNCDEGVINGKISLKRQYQIEKQKLKLFLDTSETINDEILLETLSKNSSSKMREIVSTIQKEQNKLIRCDEMKNLLVQGVAGSGKTSIALHRAGYLLYKNKEMTNEDVFILSPSHMFSEYINQVLPELGEENVIHLTFENIAKSELNKKIHSRESLIDELLFNKNQNRLTAVAYKSSFEFLEELNLFLKDFYSKTFNAKTLSFYIKESDPLFVFTKEEMEKLYYNTYKDLSIWKRVSYMSEYLIERFNLKKNEFLPIKERFSKMLYRFFPSTDPQEILNLFLSSKGISVNDSCEFDDIAGLLIVKDYMFGLSTDIKAKYLIIDEMQDFTPAHFYIFNKIWNCPKLILGDINQCIEKTLTPEYLSRLSKFLDAEYISLNKTYRSTKEISSVCEKIINLKNIVKMNRSGEKPSLIETFSV